jgi:hypothetical protein
MDEISTNGPVPVDVERYHSLVKSFGSSIIAKQTKLYEWRALDNLALDIPTFVIGGIMRALLKPRRG